MMSDPGLIDGNAIGECSTDIDADEALHRVILSIGSNSCRGRSRDSRRFETLESLWVDFNGKQSGALWAVVLRDQYGRF